MFFKILKPASAILLLLLHIAPFPSASAEPKKGQDLRIGVISLKAEKRLKGYAPLAEYLAKRLGRFGIHRGKVLVTKDIEGMNQLIKEEGVDLVLESAVPAIEMERKGMVPSLLAWRKGVREYRTVIIVGKNSTIKTLAELKGKRIVFEDALSTSAFAIPLVELKKNGLRPMAADEKGIPEDAVRYFFAGEALNEAYWVTQGKAHAAAISNNDWEDLPHAVRAELRVIHQTNPILRYIVSIRSDMQAPLKQEIENILLHMDADAAGMLALESASEIRKIERFRDEDLRSLEYVRSLMKYLD